MKDVQNKIDLIQQKESIVSKSQKHDVNLKFNSSLFFQVGIIICLLISFALFEMSFKTNDAIIQDFPEYQDDDMYVFNDPIKIYKKPIPIEKKKSVILNNPIISDNDSPITDLDIFTEPDTNEAPMDPQSVTLVEMPDEIPPINIMAVEQVPIFPGCEDATTNEERRQCMSDKIATHVQKKFNSSIGGNLGLKGEQRIYVLFKIDKNGYVTDIKTSAQQSQLDKEASRVVGKLPQMIPGKQKDKNVEVLYSLPIKFHILN